MTNKQNLIMAKLREIILQNILEDGRKVFKFCGVIPDNSQCGNKFPAVFLKDGSEDYNSNGEVSSGMIDVEMNLQVFIHDNQARNASARMNELQNLITTYFLQNLSLDGTAAFIWIDRAEKGNLIHRVYEENDIDTAGYYANHTVRELRFGIRFFDSRTV